MQNVRIYATRIENTLDAYKPKVRPEILRTLLGSEGLDANLPILYGYDAAQQFFWFRNDPRGELIELPLHKVKVWPEGTPPRD